MATVQSVPSASNVHVFPAGSRVVEGTASAPRLGLSPVERLAITRLFGETGVIADVAVDRANAYATDGAARRRSLARALAIAEAQMQQLQVALADAVKRGDSAASRDIGRATDGATRRYVLLIEQLRLETQDGHRTVVLVANAGEVTVNAGS